MFVPIDGMAESESQKQIYAALVALFELAHEATAEPYPRSRTLRFILAYLHTHGKGDRSAFEEFWQTAVHKNIPGLPLSRSGERHGHLKSAIRLMCTHHGWDYERVRGTYKLQERAWILAKRPDLDLERHYPRMRSSGRPFNPEATSPARPRKPPQPA